MTKKLANLTVNVNKVIGIIVKDNAENSEVEATKSGFMGKQSVLSSQMLQVNSHEGFTLHIAQYIH